MSHFFFGITTQSHCGQGDSRKMYLVLLCIYEIVNNVPFDARRFYIVFTTLGFVVISSSLFRQ